ncbi:hypothetical protein [Actinokineospora enzanensis]|nr:hypothetical protein [Actinokineospora enzanensis]
MKTKPNVVLSLRGRQLAAKACGQCSGSSNDGKLRTAAPVVAK